MILSEYQERALHSLKSFYQDDPPKTTMLIMARGTGRTTVLLHLLSWLINTNMRIVVVSNDVQGLMNLIKTNFKELACFTESTYLSMFNKIFVISLSGFAPLIKRKQFQKWTKDKQSLFIFDDITPDSPFLFFNKTTFTPKTLIISPKWNVDKFYKLFGCAEIINIDVPTNGFINVINHSNISCRSINGNLTLTPSRDFVCDESECNICCSPFSNTYVYYLTCCKHVICMSCTQTWFGENPTCPYCRKIRPTALGSQKIFESSLHQLIQNLRKEDRKVVILYSFTDEGTYNLHVRHSIPFARQNNKKILYEGAPSLAWVHDELSLEGITDLIVFKGICFDNLQIQTSTCWSYDDQKQCFLTNIFRINRTTTTPLNIHLCTI
jgi:zinc-RING finger domain/Type III restriction enzyme, res subunit